MTSPPSPPDGIPGQGRAPARGRRAPTSTGAGDPGPSFRWGRLEIVSGLVLLLVTAVGGAYVAHGNAPSALDRWVPAFLQSGHRSVLTDITSLRYPLVIVGGAAVFALVAFPRDRARSLVCLVGPPLALLTAELVIKPLVDRTLGSGLSYPSGSTVGAAALGTAAVLAVPAHWRPVTVVVAAAYGSWMAVAVISLQWHYPSDALAGLAYGCGVVLVLDWVVRLVAGALHHTRAGPRHGTVDALPVAEVVDPSGR